MISVYLFGNAQIYGNYRRAVEAAGGTIQFGGDPTGCHALLLPGGGDLEPWRYGQVNQGSKCLEPERDAAELALLEAFVQAGKPVLGVCRGFQVINVFFGGTLAQDVPGHCAVSGIDRFHWVYSLPSPFTRTGRLIVNSAHHQAADRIGRGLQIVQWAPDGTPEAFCHQLLPVWGVQWHPERMPGVMGAQLIHRFLKFAEKTENPLDNSPAPC